MKYTGQPITLSIGLLASCFLTSCTRLTVTRLPPQGNTSAAEGVKYSLPKPYIQVTPQEDGSVVADVVYLPDPDHTYVIHGRSYLAAHTLTISTEEGLLKKVVWTGDSAAVVSQGIASTAAVAEKQLTAQAAAVKADDTKLETAKKAVDDATIAVETAQSNLELLVVNNADAEAILKSKLVLNEAQIKLAHALANLDRLRGVTKRTGDAPPNASLQIAGPILYSINERVTTNGSPTVKLVATSQTTTSGTNKQPKYPADPAYKAPKEPDKGPEFFPKGVEGLRPDRNGNLQLVLIASSPLFEVVADDSRLESNGRTMNLPPISLQTPTTVRVALAGTAAGDYTLKLAFKTERTGATNSAEIKFRVLP